MNTIPAVLHQIWIGPLERPIAWMDTWRNRNPHMAYWLWGDKEIAGFNLRHQAKYDYLVSQGEYRGASDIARIEILERYGGVYIDADSVCIETIDNAPFMKTKFFVNKEFDHKRGDWKDRVQNAHIGTIAHHPILIEYLDRMATVDVATDWMKLGAEMLTTIIDEQIMLLPIGTFTPTNYDGREASPTKAYAYHKWGTTLGTYEDSRS